MINPFQDKDKKVAQARVVGKTNTGEIIVSGSGGRTQRIPNSTGASIGIGANVVVVKDKNNRSVLGSHGYRNTPKQVRISG